MTTKNPSDAVATERMHSMEWIACIESDDPSIRNRSVESLAERLNVSQLLEVSEDLDRFRRSTSNLYHRVRAGFLLSAIYRYFLPDNLKESCDGMIPFSPQQSILERRFSEAIEALRAEQNQQGPTQGVASALAKAYYQQAFQTLADQVRESVRTVRGNQWMFRIAHPDDHPLRVHPLLLQRDSQTSDYRILLERTSVRMDFSHSAWSDIFFLGMDFPEGARVLNASINLGVHGRDLQPRPPLEAYFRVIDRPVLRLVSTDLGVEAEIQEIDEVFDFAKDHLGLLKAAVIASGLIPPAMEGCGRSIKQWLQTITQRSDIGVELVSKVNDIPKGSRLAVSTNLLGCLISVLMRATKQTDRLEGELSEKDQSLITARAILGEWLGGSGGGWQDSGGIWPGIKRIEGVIATREDPEFGISRGRLLPKHHLLDSEEMPIASRNALESSLILLYGGMAQNVGPILEMVTEKYLVRGDKEWRARQRAIEIYEEIVQSLREGDIRRLARLTTENFRGPLQTIIPWCTNRFTEALIERCEAKWGEDFWGFLMLGGMSGGGMGFFFAPKIQTAARAWLVETAVALKRSLQMRLPFAMDPVVFDFAINERGSYCEVLEGDRAVMPDGYFSLIAPKWIRKATSELSEQSKQDLIRLNQRCGEDPLRAQRLLERLLPNSVREDQETSSLTQLLIDHGFDREEHEYIRSEILAGRISLAANRISTNSEVTDVLSGDIEDLRGGFGESRAEHGSLGQRAIAAGEVGVITLAAGVGSRWTNGAGVVKGLHPFCKFQGKHRSFVEVHLAKSMRTCEEYQVAIPHVFATGYLTHDPIAEYLGERENFKYPGQVILSRGMSVGLRMVPTVRDLLFYWQETPHQRLDHQQEKVRESVRHAMESWARGQGEGSDYTGNLPEQCMHPVGHWYEIANLLRNGTLERMLREHPNLKVLFLHNIDTLGANLDSVCLTKHLESGACLTFEMVGRKIDDRGGGLARVDGRVRILEGLAMPNDRTESRLTFYSSMSTWIDIDGMLAHFGLDRGMLGDSELVHRGVRGLAAKLPTYLTIKEVKKRWGLGQEDIFPVTQYEKLWGDMTSLHEVKSHYLAVPTRRGQQLKDPGQLDGWVRDGSAGYVERLSRWSR
jgi:UTP--glucose-1-phosphate uridylyltransferase